MTSIIHNSYFYENAAASNTKSKNSGNGEKVFSKELSKINNHITVRNIAINISEDAFKAMKEDPEYKEKILNLIKRDLAAPLLLEIAL